MFLKIIKNNILILTVLFVCTLTTFNASQISNFRQLDLTFLGSLFTKVGQFNVIKNGYPDSIISEDISKEKLVKAPAVFNEQCIFECIKNPYCVRYSFNSSQNLCRIYLTPQRRSFDYDQKTATKIKEQIGVDLQNCANGEYCTDVTEKTSNSFCNPFNAFGEKCQYKNSFELTEWSEWTSCSLTCDEGFRKRERLCLRSYYDQVKKKMVKEISSVENLCQNGTTKKVLLKQVESCTIKKCLIYNQWSPWGSCTRLCDGSRNRSRSCVPEADNKYCSSVYLNEKEPCGYNNCTALNIGLDENKKTNASGPLVSGVLLINSDLETLPLRIFTLTDDSSKLNKIGRIACNEIGFTGLSWISASPLSQIKQDKSPIDYLSYIKKNIYGLECLGYEKTIKECITANEITYEQDLFELYLECYSNGYWSHWNAWASCSVTCGAGIRLRYRACNDPPPTVTDRVNGSNCPNLAVGMEQCTRPRCDQNVPL